MRDVPTLTRPVTKTEAYFSVLQVLEWLSPGLSTQRVGMRFCVDHCVTRLSGFCDNIMAVSYQAILWVRALLNTSNLQPMIRLVRKKTHKRNATNNIQHDLFCLLRRLVFSFKRPGLIRNHMLTLFRPSITHKIADNGMPETALYKAFRRITGVEIHYGQQKDVDRFLTSGGNTRCCN